MDDSTLKTFEDSLQRCNSNPNFLDRFYEVFLASSPKVKEKFAQTDFVRQKRALRASLLKSLQPQQVDPPQHVTGRDVAPVVAHGERAGLLREIGVRETAEDEDAVAELERSTRRYERPIGRVAADGRDDRDQVQAVIDAVEELVARAEGVMRERIAAAEAMPGILRVGVVEVVSVTWLPRLVRETGLRDRARRTKPFSGNGRGKAHDGPAVWFNMPELPDWLTFDPDKLPGTAHRSYLDL